MGMNLIELKLIFSVVVFIGGAFGVLAAWAPREGARGERFMAWGRYIRWGMLAGAALVHLLNAGAVTKVNACKETLPRYDRNGSDTNALRGFKSERGCEAPAVRQCAKSLDLCRSG
jgi:hypothetical protein